MPKFAARLYVQGRRREVCLPDLLSRVRSALADRYAVDRLVGGGGAATVYVAEDLKHGRQVAIKVLHPELAASVGTDRFLQEIDIVAKLQHPHILPLFDSGVADGLLYYVMPFVEEESMRARLDREGSLPVSDALDLTRQILSALDYAHSAGVVHRDIKPENVMMSRGHAIVADFGIARAIDAAGGQPVTGSGVAVGTPTYMSPEQATGDADVDARTDVYGVGCMLFEMLAGRPPFESGSYRGTIAKHMTQPAPSLRGIRETVPSAVDEAVRRALAKDPADRFAGAAAFRDALAPRAAMPSLVQRIGMVGVLGLYVAAGVALLAATRFVTFQLGLPGWTMTGVLALLVAGMPIMVVALIAERRGAAGRLLRRWPTWRNALNGGAVAVFGWGIVVGLYMTMRLMGVGPVGSLVAAGVLDARGRLILADFENRTADSTLAQAVTEALRVDLSQSTIVSLVDPRYLLQAMERMELDPGSALDAELARELAIREGVEAVLTGEVNAAGSGFVLSARLLAASDGTVLAAYRETARDSSQVIRAIDRLSDRLRARIGESLKTIRRAAPLERVTTNSLAALRKYSRAVQASDAGDVMTARSLFQEAIRLDTMFAMAYRALGVVSLERAQQVDALTRAYAYQDRLTDRERYLTQGTYYTAVTNERQRAIAAYRALLETDPEDYTALNNLAGLHFALRDYAGAEELYGRAVSVDTGSPAAFSNLVSAQVAQGKLVEARRTLRSGARGLPGNPVVELVSFYLESAVGEYANADSVLRDLAASQVGNLFWQANASSLMYVLDLLRGRLTDAERHASEAIRAAEQIGISAISLNGEIGLAMMDLWFRDRPQAALRRLEMALQRYPLADIDPRNRPYLTLAQVFALAERPVEARAMLHQFDAAIPSMERQVFVPARHAIQGLVAVAEGRPEQASAEFTRADDGACAICLLPLRGMAFDQAGEADSVIAVYERFLSTPWMARVLNDAVFRAPIYERLAQLHAQRGQPDSALAYHAKLVALWQDADPELQARVEVSRRALRAEAGR